ncbi:MAG: carboxylating nicotinate-nucleotide diphosphorylase [Rubrimonas sp.]
MTIPPLPRVMVEPVIRAALLEDLGRAGDVTTDATIPPDALASARIAARQDGVAAGVAVATQVFEIVGPDLSIEVHAPDGARVEAGRTLLTVRGRAHAILTAERVALNFAGRLSGIATLTRRFADAIAHTRCRVAATRKTTPGLRMLEKHAVRLGGGAAHRYGLDDAILIKDNHIAACGGIAAALDRARAHAGHMMKIEIEVDRLDQLDEVLAAGGADAILLDNMDLPTLREAVARIGGRAVAEASGGVTLDRVAAIAETGVDLVSTGALTHSAPVLDLGLDLD